MKLGQNCRATSPHFQQIRFWNKVDQSEECWIWKGTKQIGGYGVFKIHGKSMQRAHRLAYAWLRGPIPDGLTLDHLCRVTACVNPEHLEPVEMVENVMRGGSIPAVNARKTHCKRGHNEWRILSQYSNGKPRRVCVPCVRAFDRARWKVKPRRAS
jgi:hypothetical protein